MRTTISSSVALCVTLLVTSASPGLAAKLVPPTQKDFCPRGHHLVITRAEYNPAFGKLRVRGESDTGVTLSVLAADSGAVVASVMNASGGDWSLRLDDLDRNTAPGKIVAWSTAGCRTQTDIAVQKGGGWRVPQPLPE